MSPVDQHVPLREQRHRALVDAARALATETGADGFTVDRVATLAGVSRRTVFNHFAAVDELLVAVCEQILAEVTTDLLEGSTAAPPTRPHAHAGGPAAPRRGVRGHPRRRPAAAIAAIVRVLDVSAHEGERGEAISQAALDHVGDRLAARARASTPPTSTRSCCS